MASPDGLDVVEVLPVFVDMTGKAQVREAALPARDILEEECDEVFIEYAGCDQSAHVWLVQPTSPFMGGH
jgi:hypothetical protein